MSDIPNFIGGGVAVSFQISPTNHRSTVVQAPLFQIRLWVRKRVVDSFLVSSSFVLARMVGVHARRLTVVVVRGREMVCFGIELLCLVGVKLPHVVFVARRLCLFLQLLVVCWRAFMSCSSVVSHRLAYSYPFFQV